MSEPVREDPVIVRQSLRWQRAGAVVLFILVIAFPLYKAVESGRRADALTAQDRALMTSGQQLWGLNCASCHGVNGEGVTAPALNSQGFLTSTTDEQMAGIIRGGVPGTAMPAWWNEYGGPLTDQQIESVVAYVRSWEPTAPTCPDWRTPSCAAAASSASSAPGSGG
jgi:mono/diheme cytochrome c family protein